MWDTGLQYASLLTGTFEAAASVVAKLAWEHSSSNTVFGRHHHDFAPLHNSIKIHPLI